MYMDRLGIEACACVSTNIMSCRRDVAEETLPRSRCWKTQAADGGRGGRPTMKQHPQRSMTPCLRRNLVVQALLPPRHCSVCAKLSQSADPTDPCTDPSTDPLSFVGKFPLIRSFS